MITVKKIIILVRFQKILSFFFRKQSQNQSHTSCFLLYNHYITSVTWSFISNAIIVVFFPYMKLYAKKMENKKVFFLFPRRIGRKICITRRTTFRNVWCILTSRQVKMFSVFWHPKGIWNIVNICDLWYVNFFH